MKPVASFLPSLTFNRGVPRFGDHQAAVKRLATPPINSPPLRFRGRIADGFYSLIDRALEGLLRLLPQVPPDPDGIPARFSPMNAEPWDSAKYDRWGGSGTGRQW